MSSVQPLQGYLAGADPDLKAKRRTSSICTCMRRSIQPGSASTRRRRHRLEPYTDPWLRIRSYESTGTAGSSYFRG
jgi:hypothetical protein